MSSNKVEGIGKGNSVTLKTVNTTQEQKNNNIKITGNMIPSETGYNLGDAQNNKYW
jgi:hypothetical protein